MSGIVPYFTVSQRRPQGNNKSSLEYPKIYVVNFQQILSADKFHLPNFQAEHELGEFIVIFKVVNPLTPLFASGLLTFLLL